MIDLNPHHLAAVKRILAEHAPDCEARAFGSRAAWTAKDHSDLDIALVGSARLDTARLERLKEAFEESDLPIRVDILDWHAVSPNFRKAINRNYTVIQSGASADGLGNNPTKPEWRTSTLGECVAINPDAYSPKEAWPFINYLDTGSVTENLVSDIQRLTPGEDKIPARARRKVKRGDIVYSTVRPNQKHYGIIKDIPDNFLASTGFAVIRAKQDIADTGFIYYFLTQTHIVEHLHTIAEESMTAYPAIRPSDIERLEIHLPPRPTQRAIARILGAFDDKIALNARMNATLEAMAQALFRAWFIDFEPVRAKRSGRWRPGQTLPGMPAALYDLFPAELTPTELGDVPVGWELRTIGDLAHVSSGKRPPKRYRTPSDEASVPVYGGNGVMAYVAEPLIDYPILMTGRAGTLGSVFRITEPCWLSDNTLIVKPIDGKSFDFLLFSLERVDYRNLNRGSTQPLLAQSDLKAQLIVVPPTAILEYFQGCSSSMYNKHDAITAESRTLADMRDTLLPKLMSGEVPVE